MSTPFYDLASLVVVPSGYKASKVYAQKPLTTDGQLTFSRASTATRVNSAGLIETVSSNVPRLDYLNSSCPRLILEGQRTNSILWSENFDNATWIKVATTVTANNAVSPDGYTNADALVENTATNLHVIYQAFVSTSSTAYTFSCYIKPSTRTRAYLRSDTSAGTVRTLFDLTGSGSVVTLNHTSASISLVGNGWYRCSITFTEGTGAAGRLLFVEGAVGTSVSYAGNGLTAFWIYGAQLEAGSYATSYVKTEASAVTRLADACSKTGISSLIGQTEGTIYIDVDNNETETSCIISTNAGAGAGSHIYIGQNGSNLALYMRNAGTYSIIAGSIANIIGRKKIAVAYGSSFARIFMNGTQVFNSTSAVIPSGLDRVEINAFNINTDIGNKKCREVLYFKSKLTDAQLAELTTL